MARSGGVAMEHGWREIQVLDIGIQIHYRDFKGRMKGREKRVMERFDT